jgi:hypothetical protein
MPSPVSPQTSPLGPVARSSCSLRASDPADWGGPSPGSGGSHRALPAVLLPASGKRHRPSPLPSWPCRFDPGHPLHQRPARQGSGTDVPVCSRARRAMVCPSGRMDPSSKGADRGLRGGQGLAVSESAGTPRSGRVGSGASPAPSKRATKRPRGPGRPDAPLAPPTDSTGASGLAGIVGGGQSQVGISGAMRARDVSRPWPEDDEAAERETVVRRRPGNAASPASVPPHRPAADGGHQGSSGNSPDRS